MYYILLALELSSWCERTVRCVCEILHCVVSTFLGNPKVYKPRETSCDKHYQKRMNKSQCTFPEHVRRCWSNSHRIMRASLAMSIDHAVQCNKQYTAESCVSGIRAVLLRESARCCGNAGQRRSTVKAPVASASHRSLKRSCPARNDYYWWNASGRRNVNYQLMRNEKEFLR